VLQVNSTVSATTALPSLTATAYANAGAQTPVRLRLRAA
jgi:hypothetical protein